MEKYKVALYCYNCKHTWTIKVNKRYKIFEHTFGSTVVPDNCHYIDQSIYDLSITCPECDCKSGVKKA